jgi:hypothetical protein
VQLVSRLQSTLLVPGQLLSAPAPNDIVLDTETGEAFWQTARLEWIPEKGFIRSFRDQVLVNSLFLSYEDYPCFGTGFSPAPSKGRAPESS